MLIVGLYLDRGVPHGEEGEDDADGGHEEEEEDGGQAELVAGCLPRRDVLPEQGQHRVPQAPVTKETQEC